LAIKYYPARPRFDGVQILDDDEAAPIPFVRVLGILELKDRKHQDKVQHLFVVARLEEVNKNRSDKFIPFPLCKYTIQRGGRQVDLDIISVDCIYRPCMLIPCVSRGGGCNSQFDHRLTPKLRTTAVPYKELDQSEYENYTAPVEPTNAAVSMNTELPLDLHDTVIQRINTTVVTRLGYGYESDSGDERDVDSD
jgi:hypothetical protein